MKKSLFVWMIILTIGVLLFAACSSPDNDGAAFGAKVNECLESHSKDLQRLECDFGKTASYNSRKEAKLDYYKSRDDINTNYKNCLDEIYHEAIQKKREYNDDKKRTKFEKAFSSAIDCDLQKQIQIESTKTNLPYNVLACLMSINPIKPNVNQIQKDLVGHSLSEGVANGYYPLTWQWIIREGEISEFAIDRILSDTHKEYIIIANMRLTSEVGKAFDATVKIRYILPDDDDWSIDFIQSQGMYIVKTLIYNDCVKLEKGDYWYYLVNKCDVALEVGGKELHYHGWEKYVHVVPAHSQYCMYNPDEIIIDYVERP